MINKFEDRKRDNIIRNKMNVNSPVFIPQTLHSNGSGERYEFVNSLRKFHGCNMGHFTSTTQDYLFHFYNIYQQPVNWMVTHVAEPTWNNNMVHFNKYDTMQRRSSKDSHQRDQSVSSSSTGKLNESGNDMNQSQNQQQTNSSNINKSTKGQNNRNQSNSGGGGGVNKRHHDNKGHSHPWLVTTLKGHTSEIRDMDFSSNGKYLASCAEDRTILIWACSQIEDSKNRKSFRINVEYDFGTKLAWSPDNKAIAIHKSVENCIEVYKIEKKDGWFTNPTKGITFPKVTDCDIIGFGIACTGRYMMTCTNKTDLYIWDLRGNILEKIDTYLMNNYSGKISPCGRFVAACGFAPDCKIWEVKFAKNGEYQKTMRAFDLSGHTSGIYDLAFDQDTSHIATVSKDGTWKLFDTKIEYEKGQSPRCIKTAKYSKSYSPCLIALSLNAEVLAIAGGSNVELFSTLTGERDIIIKNHYDGCINLLTFDSFGKFLFTAADRYIRIYHNVTGYKTSIVIAQNKLKTNLTAATRERFEKMIDEYQAFLKKFA